MSEYLVEFRHHAGLDCQMEGCVDCGRKRKPGAKKEAFPPEQIPVREDAHSQAIATTIIQQLMGRGFGFVNLEDYLQRETGKMFQWSKPNRSTPEGKVMVKFKGRGSKPGTFGLDITYNEGADLYDIEAWFQGGTGTKFTYNINDADASMLASPDTLFGGIVRQVMGKAEAKRDLDAEDGPYPTHDEMRDITGEYSDMVEKMSDATMGFYQREFVKLDKELFKKYGHHIADVVDVKTQAKLMIESLTSWIHDALDHA